MGELYGLQRQIEQVLDSDQRDYVDVIIEASPAPVDLDGLAEAVARASESRRTIVSARSILPRRPEGSRPQRAHEAAPRQVGVANLADLLRPDEVREVDPAFRTRS